MAASILRKRQLKDLVPSLEIPPPAEKDIHKALEKALRHPKLDVERNPTRVREDE